MRPRSDVLVRIQAALTPDLLNPDWKRRRNPNDHPVTGFCYVATEALYHVWGRDRGYRPHVLGRDVMGGITHWYLRHPDGHILDPTADQFPEPPPYHLGRACGFLTREPSRRARILIERGFGMRGTETAALQAGEETATGNKRHM